VDFYIKLNAKEAVQKKREQLILRFGNMYYQTDQVVIIRAYLMCLVSQTGKLARNALGE